MIASESHFARIDGCSGLFASSMALVLRCCKAPYRYKPAPICAGTALDKIEENFKKSGTKDLQNGSGFDLWIGNDSIDAWRISLNGVRDRGRSL